MRLHVLAALAPTFLLSSTLTVAARAEPVCMTVDEFNTFMAGIDGKTTTLDLQFDVTGVNPADYFGSKGCLAELVDASCALGASAALKVYGTADPPNLSHPAGTLKFEYGNQCCPAPPCLAEGWASPNPGEIVFANGTEQCVVTAWLDPAQFGYSIDCGGTLFEAVGDNVDALQVDKVSLFKLINGGWEMPNAVSTYNQICFEPPVVDPATPVLTIPVLEDATAAVGSDSVYTPIEDISVGTGEGEIFLKFDLGAVPGRIEKAKIFLHQSDIASAEGDGGDAFAAAHNGWSETTLTWNNRPAKAGASLSRQSPIATFDWYSWDVSPAVEDPGVYSFAIVPEAADANGAHFFSKEGSSTFAPYMRVEYVVVDGDGDGHPDGPDCDDAAATVFPGAPELCNGVDDDCDGAVDDGCAGGAGGGGTGPTGGGGDGTAGNVPWGNGVGTDETGAAGPGGCACRAPRGAVEGRDATWLLLALAAGAGVRSSMRSRRVRRERARR